MRLFISNDLGTGSSGDIVCEQELEALKSLRDKGSEDNKDDIIKIEHSDINPELYGLSGDNPFMNDYLAMNKISQLWFGPEIDVYHLCHIYGTTFTNTIRYLKANGVKVTNTIAAHDRKESINEFGNLGIQFPFKHLTDEKLWNMYVGCAREVDIVIVPSELSKEFLMKEGTNFENIRIIPHGVNIPDDSKIRSIPEKFNIGYLGGLGPDKGIRYLIESWSMLNCIKDGKNAEYKDSTLIIAGRGSEQLGGFINRFAKGGNFHLAGWVDNVSDFFGKISVYVQPSVSEGFGMEIVQAMSYERPVIVSDGCGAADCVTDGVDGFIVEKRDIRGIADKIQYFKDNPKEIERMGKNARKKSLDYDWKIIRQKYIDVWKELIN